MTSNFFFYTKCIPIKSTNWERNFNFRKCPSKSFTNKALPARNSFGDMKRPRIALWKCSQRHRPELWEKCCKNLGLFIYDFMGRNIKYVAGIRIYVFDQKSRNCNTNFNHVHNTPIAMASWFEIPENHRAFIL